MSKQILKKIVLVSSMALIIVAFQNCGIGSFSADISTATEVLTSASPDSIPEVELPEAKKVEISSFHFYYGGWYPAPNTPSWSDDIHFNLKDNVLSADSKTTDELCTKPLYVVGDQDRIAILKLIAELKFVTAQDLPPMADSGAKKITLKMKDQSEKVIFLRQAGAQNGDTLATNGSELASYLENLNKKIPVACKVTDETSGDLVSFSYFNGGGFPAPGTPSWKNDIKFRVIAGSVLVKSKVHDSLCFKPEYTLTPAEASAILSAAVNLDIKAKTEAPMVADAPTDKITLTFQSGEEKVVHLSNHSAAVGELLASNGAALAKLLQELDERLPMACQ